jgi:hypothetical protein
LPQLPTAAKAGVGGGFDLIENREAAFDFGDDILLLRDWRDGNRKNATL